MEKLGRNRDSRVVMSHYVCINVQVAYHNVKTEHGMYMVHLGDLKDTAV